MIIGIIQDHASDPASRSVDPRIAYAAAADTYLLYLRSGCARGGPWAESRSLPSRPRQSTRPRRGKRAIDGLRGAIWNVERCSIVIGLEGVRTAGGKLIGVFRSRVEAASAIPAKGSAS